MLWYRSNKRLSYHFPLIVLCLPVCLYFGRSLCKITLIMLYNFYFQLISWTLQVLFNQVFNENPGYQICEWRAVGGRILNGVKLRFPLKNFSLLWPIHTKLAVQVAFIKRQLGIATQVSVIKVKVTVTKNRNSVSAQ